MPVDDFLALAERAPPLAADADPSLTPGLTRAGGNRRPLGSSPACRTADNDCVQPEQRPLTRRGPSARVPMVLTVVALLLFATGTGPRPAGEFWATAYDLVLYNAVCVGATWVCFAAARRSPTDRLAWTALGLSQLCNVAGNLIYTLLIAPMPDEPYPSLADVFYLVYFLPLYVALVALIRSRVPRFHASMWLDGIIGALGASAVAVALLLAPALETSDGDTAAVLTNLAYPTGDVVLLALLVAVGAILGVRRDRTLLLLGAGMVANLVGDVVFLDLNASGTYVEGGPLDLTWLVAAALLALAAHTSRPVVPGARHHHPGRLAGARAAAGLQRRQPARPGHRLGRPHLARRRVVRHRLRAGRPRADRGDLPRGPLVQRGARTGTHRRADRAAEPPGPHAGGRGGPGGGAPPGARRRCCSSTSTGSRRSTTASATTPATTCSGRSGRGCARAAQRRPARPPRRRRVRRPAARRRPGRGRGARRPAAGADPPADHRRGHPAARAA